MTAAHGSARAQGPEPNPETVQSALTRAEEEWTASCARAASLRTAATQASAHRRAAEGDLAALQTASEHVTACDEAGAWLRVES